MCVASVCSLTRSFNQVREHKKKERKSARNALKGPQKKKKDPGIPNAWPFKEQVLLDIEEEKAALGREKERQKELRMQSIVSDPSPPRCFVLFVGGVRFAYCVWSAYVCRSLTFLCSNMLGGSSCQGPWGYGSFGGREKC